MAKDFKYQETFPLGKDKTEYYLLTKEHVSVSKFDGQEILKVEPEALTVLARAAMRDCSFLLRPAHQAQVAAILADPEASENDKYVALTMLRNAEIAAKGILPFCQDTGTATVYAKKAALNMYDEVNTGTNLPAQIDLVAGHGNEYKFLFIAKGGGSANKSYLFQETKALLNPASLEKFLTEKMKTLGTAACPPYHIAFVIGGTSADACMKTVKLASTKYYDKLPTEGNELGQAFRDVEMEQKILKQAQASGFGAQFGGKYFAHDVRIVRLSRHGASCFVGMAVSCSADRNIKGKINKDGVWVERMEDNPGRLIPEELRNEGEGNAVKIDLNMPMKDILAILSKYPVSTRLSLNGTIVVGRDIAHAKLKELIDAGKPLPQYVKDHPIYYAGPAKTPKGMPSGSFGPTTAGRMDSYVDLFQENGGSLIMIAKGNRTQQVTDACKKYGGFYLGSIGGPAAILAQQNIKKVECLEYPELGMEAIWKIEVENFPAFILVDDKGNDFFKQIKPNMVC